jgi:hypothetical protein
MYIDMSNQMMPFFSDETKQMKHFFIVFLSSVISSIYLKKENYEYLGLWLMFFTFILFIVFAMLMRKTLWQTLGTFIPDTFSWEWPNNNLPWLFPNLSKISGGFFSGDETFRIYFIGAFFVLCSFLFITISLIMFLVSTTAIVRKKTKKGKITGNEKTDSEYKSRPFQITDLEFLKDTIHGKISGKAIYNNIRSGFDTIIVAVFALILAVYGSQVSQILGGFSVYAKTFASKMLLIVTLVAFISSCVALGFSAETTRVNKRLKS